MIPKPIHTNFRAAKIFHLLPSIYKTDTTHTPNNPSYIPKLLIYSLIKIKIQFNSKPTKHTVTYSKFMYPLKPKKKPIVPSSPSCQLRLHLQKHPIVPIARVSSPLGSVSFQFFISFGMHSLVIRSPNCFVFSDLSFS